MQWDWDQGFDAVLFKSILSLGGPGLLLLMLVNFFFLHGDQLSLLSSFARTAVAKSHMESLKRQSVLFQCWKLPSFS